MYYSRSYLREKYDSIKSDIENVLDVYNEESDSIPEEDVERVKANLRDKIEAIINELGIRWYNIKHKF